MDPAGLLNLPTSHSSCSSEADFEESCDGVLGVMETMLSVAYKQAVNVITTGKSDRDVVAFNNLLSSLQISLLSWCHQQIVAPQTPKGRHASIFSVIKTYTQLMTNKAVALCRDVLEMVARAEEEAMATDEDHPFDVKTPEITLASLVTPLESSFMASTLRILVMTLSSKLASIVDSATRVHLLQTIMPLAAQFDTLAQKLPQFFYRVDSEEWHDYIADDVVLRTWDVESPHNYENNQHSIQVGWYR